MPIDFRASLFLFYFYFLSCCVSSLSFACSIPLSEEEKDHILADTGITAKQLTCWFSNNRKRFWKPKMEEMGK